MRKIVVASESGFSEISIPEEDDIVNSIFEQIEKNSNPITLRLTIRNYDKIKEDARKAVSKR